MAEQNNDFESTSEQRFRSRRKFTRMIAIIMILLLMLAAGAYAIFYPRGAINSAQSQPVPFSHRVHATDKKISCYFCHSQAINTDHAGIPALETCMLCHRRVAIYYPPIVRVQEYYKQKKPIEWVRINDVPDFVYFSHQMHIRSGFDCGRCHGNVAQMDRVRQPERFTMGYCVSCHRQENASHDCLICHR